MISFELLLTDDWQELLKDGTYLAFECDAESRPEIYFSESDAPPSGVTGFPVATFPQGWDFEGSGFDAGLQRIWVRGGTGYIRGVRT